MMAKKKSKFKKKKSSLDLPKQRGTPKNHGPGLFNPFRSVRFSDKKKKANKKLAREKINKED